MLRINLCWWFRIQSTGRSIQCFIVSKNWNKVIYRHINVKDVYFRSILLFIGGVDKRFCYRRQIYSNENWPKSMFMEWIIHYAPRRWRWQTWTMPIWLINANAVDSRAVHASPTIRSPLRTIKGTTHNFHMLLRALPHESKSHLAGRRLRLSRTTCKSHVETNTE